jgi:hypothetical protein
MYLLGMQNERPGTPCEKPRKYSGKTEKLTRVRTTRRGAPVELRVHYEISENAAGLIFRLFSVEDVD